MASRSLLYYITDRSQFAGSADERRKRLLATIAEAARHRVDLIQLREKDLSATELAALARDALAAIRDNASTPGATRLLINSRLDVAIAVGAAGVHLRSDDISIADARVAVNASPLGDDFLIARSCHNLSEVIQAASEQASFVVFGPVFEKKDPATSSPVGLATLAEASRVGVPVLALGGVTLANASDCIRAGAAGIAGIRLFQHGSMQDAVEVLRRTS
jgi:thiamine-phosphate pyrophosphorylase